MFAILSRLAGFFAFVGGTVLALIVLVTTTNTGAFILDRIAAVWDRDVPGLPGYEDFVTVAISGAAALFFPYCQLKRGHVAVDLFMDRMPRGFSAGADRLWLVLTAGVGLFLAYWATFGMLEVRDDTVVTPVLGWPVWPFYLPTIAAMLLWSAIALAQVVGDPLDD